MKIAVVIPSRGLVHSRTIESVLRNLKGFDDYFIKLSHDRGIPDAHNFLAEYAQDKNADYVWYVEEDNVIPDGTLKRMVKYLEKSDYSVVAVDYPVGEKNYSTVCRKNNEIMWCGFGCTLMKMFIFNKMKKPWFDTSKSLRLTNPEKLEYVIDEIPNKYGGHDVLFGVNLRDNGFKIGQLKGITAGHARIIVKGASGMNKGYHHVDIKNQIDNYQDY